MTTMAQSAGLQPVMKPGFYNEHSQQQLTAARVAQPHTLRASQLVPVPLGSPIRILDCGSSQGRNSVLVLTELLQHLQARLQGTSSPEEVGRPEHEVEVLFEDLPSNDFNSLMSAITDATKGLPAHISNSSSTSSSSSGAGGATSLSIYPRCVGRSFYERLAPRSSLHMVTAFTCLHWICAKPCTPPDTPIPYLSEAAGVVEAYEAAFAEGFGRFLQHRAAEAVPGAPLQAHFPICNNPRPTNTTCYLDAAARQMASQGLLTQQQLGDMASCDCLVAPSLVQDVLQQQAANWELVTFEVVPIEHPVWSKLQAGEVTAAEAGVQYAKAWQAVFEPSFLAGLRQHVADDAARSLVEQLFGLTAAAYQAQPVPFVQDYVYLLLVRK